MGIEVFTDGLCQPTNPKGIACYAFVIKKENQTVHSESGLAAKPYSDGATNNVAEYTALVKSLEWLINNGFARSDITVRSDSKLIINQMQGNYRARDKRIIPIFKKAAELSHHFDKLVFEWIPREKNKEADALTEKAYNNAIINRPDLLDKTIEHSS